MKKILKMRGIVLITTLITIALCVMMLTAVIQNSIGNLRLTNNFYGRESALWAAESGVQYAMTKLQNNPYWRGEDNEVKTSEGFIVGESNGNVIGLLKAPNDNVCAFRIKFSYETDEDLSNLAIYNSFKNKPDNNYKIAMPYVSVNYLKPIITNGSKVPDLAIYRANANGEGIASSTTSLEGKKDSDISYHIPGLTAAIVVEGLSGSALQDCTNPSQIRSAIKEDQLFSTMHSSRSLTRRYIETYLRPKILASNEEIVSGNNGIDISIMNNGYLDILDSFRDGEEDENGNKNIATTGKIKSNGAINIAGNYNTLRLESPIRKNTFACNSLAINDKTFENGDYTKANSQGINIPEGSTISMQNNSGNAGSAMQISWKDVRKSETNDINPGIYEWRSNEDKSEYNLYRYTNITSIESYSSMSEKDLESAPVELVQIQDGKATGADGDTPIFSENISFDKKNMTMYINGQVGCPGDFLIRSASGTVTHDVHGLLARPVVILTPGNEEAEDTLLSCQGDIYIDGETTGSGSITSNKNITFQGPSELSNPDGSDISIYATGDINFKPITATSVDDAERGLSSSIQIDNNLFFGRYPQIQYEIFEKDIDGKYVYEVKHGRKIDLTNEGAKELEKYTINGYNYYKDRYKFIVGNPIVFIKTVEDLNNYRNERNKHPHKKIDLTGIPCTVRFSYYQINTSNNIKIDTDKISEIIKVHPVKFGDQRINGTIYAGGNINADLGGCSFTSIGKMVAKGKINIKNTTFAGLYGDYGNTVSNILKNDIFMLDRTFWASW